MTKPLFTFRDAWPWAALTFAAITACVLVWIAKGAQVYHGIITFAAAGGALGLVWLHFWRRWQEVDAWNRAPKLCHWVAVLSPITSDQLEALVECPIDVSSKWQFYTCKSNPGQDTYRVICDALNGCDVTFRPAPWMVDGELVGGMMFEEHATVVGPEYAGIERTRALIIHELSHRALTALGIPAIGIGENHHKIFEEEGIGC
jgi:hypothetical protein